MNISSFIYKCPIINKQCFSPKLVGSDGLILQIHNTPRTTDKTQKIRFLYANFNREGHILAAVDHTGNIFMIDFIQNKFWTLPTLHSCSILKFSNCNNTEIVAGTTSGRVCIFNCENGDIIGDLLGHNERIMEITFSHDCMCLTASQIEAIIWNLQSNSKMQVLNIAPRAILKHVLFMPVTGNVLACFEDDIVLIWKYNTFEVFKQILPKSWNKQTLKSIAFTRNGRAMVFSGHSPQLTIFMLDTWSVTHTIILPDSIQSIKKIDFIPQLFDGGCNRVLAILSSNGVLHFYDMDQNVVINKLVTPEEIIKFDCSINGKHLACILKSGEVNIYKVGCYVPSYSKLDVVEQQKFKNTSAVNMLTNRKSSSIIFAIKKQMKETLDKDKLASILKEYGQYPDSHRVKIWMQLLELPNNKSQYNTLINHVAHSSYENLIQSYPLENRLTSKNLKKVLSNLVTWSPAFAEITYLPVFVFPFVKVFQNEPVLCFEAVCTIIINWCQYWFEYFPLPPMNILAMIENLLLEHDPQLLKYLIYKNVTSKIYAWPLLEGAFSEVLTTMDWCRLWDHILTNEPVFIIMVVVAYNILHRNVLFTMNTHVQFQLFYHSQNVIDIKRLISKAYMLLNNTEEKNHPRQYLNDFKKLEIGAYPDFQGFPKVLIDFEFNELNNLREERKKMKKQEQSVLQERESQRKQGKVLQQQEEEKERLKELEKACRQRLNEERNRVMDQRKRLTNLHKQLHQEEMDILNKSREKIIERNIRQRQRALEKILYEVEENCAAEELEVAKAESDLVKHYSELLRHKIHLEEALNADQQMLDTSFERNGLRKHQQQLAEELEKIQNKSRSKVHLKHFNVATGIAAMDDLIARIETELARLDADQYKHINKNHSNMKIRKLEVETKELEMEVSRLLNLLANLKSQETKRKLSNLSNHITFSKTQLCLVNSHYSRQQEANIYKEEVNHIDTLVNDFEKLQKLIGQARDGYAARPSSPNNNGDTDTVPSEELAVIHLN